VRFIDTPFEQVIATTEDWETSSLTVSSLRLDTIVANGYNISRTHAKELVERGAVRVNWTDIDRPDFMLAVNDLISVRKFGRLRLMAENGLTKKDKWRVEMAVIKK
ncbi:S4 domain-containing protein, partial [Weissella soli]